MQADSKRVRQLMDASLKAWQTAIMDMCVCVRSVVLEINLSIGFTGMYRMHPCTQHHSTIQLRMSNINSKCTVHTIASAAHRCKIVRIIGGSCCCYSSRSIPFVDSTNGKINISNAIHQCEWRIAKMKEIEENQRDQLRKAHVFSGHSMHFYAIFSVKQHLNDSAVK